jgi:poly(hydroxyalkanoate) granule-associated protein
MVKKLKTLAAAGAKDSELAQTVRESAHQIWLAGLGAFAKTQEEGVKVFDALVKEGRAVEARTRKLAQSKVDEVTATVGRATKTATATWDKLEQVFEDRVARALQRLGVPTNKDIQSLAKRVEELTQSVHTLTGTAPAKPAARKRKATTSGKSAGAGTSA